MGIMIRRRTWEEIHPNTPRRLEDLLDEGVAILGLSVRTTNALESCGIIKLQQLLQRTPSQLLSIKNFGAKTLNEVFKALVALGFPEPKGFKMKKTRCARNASTVVAPQPPSRRENQATREEMVEERLSAAAALRRCVDELDMLIEAAQLNGIDAGFIEATEYVRYYADTRLPYPPEAADSAEIAEEEPLTPETGAVDEDDMHDERKEEEDEKDLEAEELDDMLDDDDDLDDEGLDVGNSDDDDEEDDQADDYEYEE